MRPVVAAVLPALAAAVLTRRPADQQPQVDARPGYDRTEDVRNATQVTVLLPSLSEPELVEALRVMFERARRPSRVLVGVVQQSSRARQAALEAPLAARLCGALGALPGARENARQSLAACGEAQRVRMYHMAAPRAEGPTGNRGRQQMLLGDADELEDFCMRIDASAVFSEGWDERAARQWAETDNEYVVLPPAASEALLETGQSAPVWPGNSGNSWAQEVAERGSVPVIVPGAGRDDGCHRRWLSAFRDRLELVVQSSALPVDNELVEPPRLRLHVSSIGGVGTTGIMRELMRLQPPIATNHRGDVDKVKHIPFGDRIRQRAPDKILYIYGDPVKAVISLDKRGWLRNQAFKVRSDKWPKNESADKNNLSAWLNDPGGDFLQIERHFGSFYHQCEFPVAFLFINEKTEHLDELADFLETNKSEVSRVLQPWKAARMAMDSYELVEPDSSTFDYDGVRDQIADKLKGAISKFKALPGFKTVIPGKDC